MSTQLQEKLDQIVSADVETEVITANENADGDHSNMMAAVFDQYATTPETEEMVLRGARESLDIDTTFTVGLSEAARLLD